MSRPTTGPTRSRLEAGDTETGRWKALQGDAPRVALPPRRDGESRLGLAPTCKQKRGDDGVAEAWGREPAAGAGSAKPARSSNATGATQLVGALAATWRAKLEQRHRREPGRFTITEDEEKFTFERTPADPGQRLGEGLQRLRATVGCERRRTTGLTAARASRSTAPLRHSWNELRPISWYGLAHLPPAGRRGPSTRSGRLGTGYIGPGGDPRRVWRLGTALIGRVRSGGGEVERRRATERQHHLPKCN